MEIFKENKEDFKIDTMSLFGLKVLVIDDDFFVRENVTSYLGRYGMEIFDKESAKNIIDTLDTIKPDVLIIDYDLNDHLGIDAIKKIRENEKFFNLPILMFTGLYKKNIEVEAFEAGVDDYLEKPFFNHQLLLRMKSLMKRKNNQLGQKFSYHGVEVCLKNFTATYNEKSLDLTKTQIIILSLLVKNKDFITRQDDILAYFNNQMKKRALDVHMTYIRQEFKKLNLEPIISLKGVGYKFYI